MADRKNEDLPLRPTGKMERFNIIRNQVQFYNNVGVLARYTIPKTLLQTGFRNLIYAALKETLNHHPILGVTIEDENSKEPKWKRLDTIDLREVVKVVDADQNGSYDTWVQEAHHVPFANPETQPLWRTVVAYQASTPDNDRHLSFALGFFAHHGIADGLSCAAFHLTFLSALNSPLTPLDSPVIAVPKLPLLPNLEQKTSLSISIPFALRKVFKTFIYNPIDPLVWSGPFISETTSRPPLCHVRSFFVSPSIAGKVVAKCREQRTTITALVTVLVARKVATMHPTYKRFVGQVPFSIRKFTGHGARDMGCMVSNTEPLFSSEEKPPRGYIACADEKDDGDEALWNSARQCRTFLEEKTASIHNQNINMLKFVPDLKGYFLGMFGRRRDHAFEVTNIGVVDGGAGGDEGKASFDRVMFSTGCCTFGDPYIIHLATAKNGEMTVTCSWEDGIVEDEGADGLLAWLEGELKKLAGSCIDDVGRRLCEV